MQPLFRRIPALVGLLALAGCVNMLASGDLGEARKAGPAPTPFLESLRTGYLSLAEREYDNYSWSTSSLLAQRSLEAARGMLVLPLAVPRDRFSPAQADTLETARAELVRVLDNGGRGSAPGPAGRAQAYFDCWVSVGGSRFDETGEGGCRDGFRAALQETVASVRPLPGPYFIQFGPGSSGLTAGGRKFVAEIVQLGMQARVGSALVGGHADSTGSPAVNARLSERRARAVADAMVAAGFPADRVQVYAYGEGSPLVEGRGQRLNRVVTVVFTY